MEDNTGGIKLEDIQISPNLYEFSPTNDQNINQKVHVYNTDLNQSIEIDQDHFEPSEPIMFNEVVINFKNIHEFKSKKTTFT